MKKSPHVNRNSSSFIRYCGNTNVTLSLLAETLPTSREAAVFDYPFSELLVSVCFKIAIKKHYMALSSNRTLQHSVVCWEFFFFFLGRTWEDSRF
jgi:hypothetical protein